MLHTLSFALMWGEREVLEVTRRTLQRQQLTSVPGTFGDPIRVIQTLPGLQRAPFGVGLLLVRGSNPDDTGIFVDANPADNAWSAGQAATR